MRLAIYNRVFNEAEARLHYAAAGGQPPNSEVRINYECDANTLVFTWSNGVLQAADNVTGEWTPVDGAASPYTVPTTEARKFFRVVVP